VNGRSGETGTIGSWVHVVHGFMRLVHGARFGSSFTRFEPPLRTLNPNSEPLNPEPTPEPCTHEPMNLVVPRE